METLGALLLLAAVVFFVSAIIAAIRKRKATTYWILAGSSFALACVLAASTSKNGGSTEARSPVRQSDAGAITSSNQEPDRSPAETKAAFLKTVNESVSGKRIEGNPRKFNGQHVDLHGKVINVVDDHTFNFQTGDVKMGEDLQVHDTLGHLVVICKSTRTLEAEQAIRVIGTVVDPMEGSNAFGGQRDFPTIEAQFIE